MGDKAPSFEGITDSGEKISFSSLIGKYVVLYFYPKDNSYGCTAEACGFRDNWEKIQSMGATVIGISSQSTETHSGFKKKNSLPFTLVSDPKNEIRKIYGATGLITPPRITFLIDKEGVVRFVFNSQMQYMKHVRDALAELQKLSSEK